MNTNSKFYNNQKGFTLLELVVVITVLGIISVVIVNLINRQAETFANVFNNSELLINSKRAMELLRKDLHAIAPDSISTMTASSLIFKTRTGETITYSKASTTLSRNGSALAEFITNNPFSYLDEDQNVTASKADLVFVKVDLEMSKLTESLELEEIIYLRN